MKFQSHLLAAVVSSCVVHVTCKWRMSIWQDLALPLSQVVLVEVVLLVLRLFHNHNPRAATAAAPHYWCIRRHSGRWGGIGILGRWHSRQYVVSSQWWHSREVEHENATGRGDQHSRFLVLWLGTGLTSVSNG